MENYTFEEQVKGELKSMDQRLYDLEEKMTSIDTKLTQVVDAILGNPLTKTGGFVNDVNFLEKKIQELEKKVNEQEEFRKRIYWGVAAIASVFLIFEYILKVYKNVNS